MNEMPSNLFEQEPALSVDVDTTVVASNTTVERAKRERERGQAAPLAAIGIFVMCLGVLATFNIGHAVHQKIKLQNTADSAAYTLAAMEARTFNYIAFLNRVQVAHYNTAMMMQSFISWVGFYQSMASTVVDLLVSLSGALGTGSTWGCPPPLGCPYIPAYPASQGWVQSAKSARDGFQQAYDGGHDLAHQFVQAMAIFNKDVIFNAQLARAALMNVNIMSGMQNYIEKNDKDISFKNGKSALLNAVVNSVMNTLEYHYAFDRAAGVSPMALALIQDYAKLQKNKGYLDPKASQQSSGKSEETTSEDAYRLMTEITHATRAPRFVFNRSGGAFATSTSTQVAMVFAAKKGATKFTSDGKIDGGKIKAIESDSSAQRSDGGQHDSSYTKGEYLSSHDYATAAGGISIHTTGAIAIVAWVGSGKNLAGAVAAYKDKVEHFYYKGTTKSPAPYMGYHPGGTMASYPTVTGIPENPKTDRCSDQGNLWPGMAPFFKFRANKERTSDYGQPSTWIFLNKHHKDFQSKWGSHADGKAPWYAKFTFTQGTQTASLDTTIGGSRNSYLFEGLNVVSRGMAYYHRPRNWGEQPNFFNPFWRARLAPVGQKLQNFWDKYVSNKITTSSDSAITKGLVNLLRNAQMDLFTSAITSLITH